MDLLYDWRNHEGIETLHVKLRNTEIVQILSTTGEVILDSGGFTNLWTLRAMNVVSEYSHSLYLFYKGALSTDKGNYCQYHPYIQVLAALGMKVAEEGHGGGRPAWLVQKGTTWSQAYEDGMKISAVGSSCRDSRVA